LSWFERQIRDNEYSHKIHKISFEYAVILRLLNINLTLIFVNDMLITVGAIAKYVRQSFQRQNSSGIYNFSKVRHLK
ncbi:MAG: hypothetical protein Q4E87_05730, partial [bacterium]|nr:hypothetical protein [bacterium]